MDFIRPSMIKKVLDLYVKTDEYINTKDLIRLFENYSDEGYFSNYKVDFIKKCEYVNTDNLYVNGIKIDGITSVETIVKRKC